MPSDTPRTANVIRRSTPSIRNSLVLATSILAVSLVSLLLVNPRGGSSPAWVRASYDLVFHFAPPPRSALTDSPVAIVYLDIDSYLREKQDPTTPWSRQLHAALLQRLTRAGARMVVFDIVFSGESDLPDSDNILARAIRDHGSVILAGELNTGTRHTDAASVATLSASPPIESLRSVAADWGLASVQVDPDFTVRQLFLTHSQSSLRSLVFSAFEKLNPQRLDSHRQAPPHNAWLRYYGPPFSIPHVSYSAALRAEEVPDRFFSNRVVIVGAKPIITGFRERRDEYRSPLSSIARRDIFMPAVEVHAVQLLNLLRQDALHRLPGRLEGLALLALPFGIGLILFRLRPIPATFAAMALEICLIGVVIALHRLSNVWFPWLIVSGFQIPALLTCSTLHQTASWLTQRRQLESARKIANAKIREQAALLDKARDAIFVQDLELHTFLYANPAAIALYHPSSPGTGTDSARQTEALQQTLTSGEWSGEFEIQRNDSSPLIVQSRWTLVRDTSGKPMSVLRIDTDITDRKRLEHQFLRAQRMQTIGTLAGGMAHDLNNALAPILLGSQILRRGETDEERLRLLEVMELNSRRGAEMVLQVLRFARGTPGDRAVLELRSLLRDMEQIARQTFPRNIRIAVLSPTDLWPVTANATELHQVLVNLCVNARDAMPDGGELSLSADNVALSPEEAQSMPNGISGEHVLILIADTGHGIAPENLQRVFEPFFSTKASGRGTGLGLPSVQRIVQNHDGFLHLRSEVGVGTTVEVYLPRARSAQTALPEPSSASSFPKGTAFGRGEWILVATDERSLREIITAALRDHGLNTLTAADGAEAVSHLDSGRQTVHLALVDWNLPGHSAFESRLHAEAPVPAPMVVWLTAEGVVPNTRSPWISKPFSVEQLLTRIQAILTGPPSSRSQAQESS